MKSHEWWFWVPITGLVVGAQFLPLELEYQRDLIGIGQAWRLFSGHWVHFSAHHFLLDAGAFMLLLRTARIQQVPHLGLGLTLCHLLISFGLMAWLPAMTVYRGLSGVDAYLMTVICVHMWVNQSGRPRAIQRWLSDVFMLGLLLKIGFEWGLARSVFMPESSGFVTVPHAHLLGLAVGVLHVSIGTIAQKRNGTLSCDQATKQLDPSTSEKADRTARDRPALRLAQRQLL